MVRGEALPLLDEAARLLGVAHKHAKGVQKTRYGIELLRFLLQPHRPKAKAERPLAWRLYRVAAEFYQASGRNGSSEFLHGCLLWLEGNEEQAMRAFSKAAKFGRASCGEDWIWLLRFAPILARKVSKRALDRFLKVSELEGVLHGESSPKANLFAKELRQHTEVSDFQIPFKPFPT